MPLSAPLPITWSIAIQTKPSQQTTAIVNLNPSQVAQTPPLNLGLADPSFCDVQQRGFIHASKLFQSMKSGFVARKSRRTVKRSQSWDGDSERLAAGPSRTWESNVDLLFYDVQQRFRTLLLRFRAMFAISESIEDQQCHSERRCQM
jgi:hypothetical protein